MPFAYVTYCSGYYGTAKEKITEPSGDVVLFPNEDKTVWTGSGKFGCYYENNSFDARPALYQCSPCCASYVEVSAGECSPDTCISLPVIVDCDLPYAKIEVTSEECECGGCAVTFDSETIEETCGDTECCGDDCSGLAGWSIALYDEDPFDICCETPCTEPIFTCSGTSCPIECTTECLEAHPDGGTNENAPDWYYVVISLVDEVGNEGKYYARFRLETDGEGNCQIDDAHEFYADTLNGLNECACTSWIYGPENGWMQAENDDKIIIGSCTEFDICCPGCGCYEVD
jgi:hypothetical protein